jgi:hypothetical protein
MKLASSLDGASSLLSALSLKQSERKLDQERDYDYDYEHEHEHDNGKGDDNVTSSTIGICRLGNNGPRSPQGDCKEPEG